MITIVKTSEKDGLITFELICKKDLFRPLFTALSSLSDIGHLLQHKSRIASAGLKRTPDQIKASEDYQKKFEQHVRSLMDKHLASGLNFNQSVSQSNKDLKAQQKFNTSYDIVQNIARRVCRK